MKIFTKHFIFLFLIGNLTFCQNNKIELTSFANIKFPGDVEITENGRDKVIVLEDSSALYMVNIRNLSNQNFSSLKGEDLMELYQGVTDGTIRAAEGTLVSMKKVNLENSFAIDIEYNSNSNPNLPNPRFKRIFFYKSNLFNIDFWPFTNNEELSKKKRLEFFNSFSIEQQNNESIIETQFEKEEKQNPSTGFKFGYIIGIIMSFLLLIGLPIFIIILLIKKSKKKKVSKADINNKNITESAISEIICKKCNSENTSQSKYCKNCGYELKQ